MGYVLDIYYMDSTGYSLGIVWIEHGYGTDRFGVKLDFSSEKWVFKCTRGRAQICIPPIVVT